MTVADREHALSPAVRLMVFLTEDDRTEHHSVADSLLLRAEEAGLAGGTVWRGIEGFGAARHLRAVRFPDLARGLPLVVELIDVEEHIANFLSVVHELAAGALVTMEPVSVSRPPPS